MKRLTTLLLLMAMFGFTACGSGGSSKKSNGKSKRAATQKAKRENPKKPKGKVDEDFVVRGGFR